MLTLFLLSSCHFSSAKESPQQCENHAQCELGFSCLNNRCRQVDCISSLDCKLKEFCTSDFECVSGCSQESDCFAGEVCIEGECEQYECRTSELDCLIGERCIDQKCMQVEPSPCEPCTYADWEQGIGGQRECVIVSYNRTIPCEWRTDEGCPDTMSCYPADGIGMVDEGVCIYSYAFFRCDVDTDCPRGFSCAQDIYANDSEIHVCWGDCNVYISQGWLE